MTRIREKTALQPPTPPSRPSTIYLYLIVLIAAVGGFLFGYDLSLISGAIIFWRPNSRFALVAGRGDGQCDPGLPLRPAGRRVDGRQAGPQAGR